MTTFQKINRKRWPTWARMTLLAFAAAMVVVLVLPSVASSEYQGSASVDVIPHVGGDAVEDCQFVEELEGAAFATAFVFSSNAARDEGEILPLTDEAGAVIAPQWGIRLLNVERKSFDWELVFNDGSVTPVEDDEGLEAPFDGNVSHVSFCLSQTGANEFTVAAVEVKGSKDTNHYFYLLELACGQHNLEPGVYQVTINCIDKDGVGALFSTGDQNNDQVVDFTSLATFGGGQAVYIEYIWFPAQPAILPNAANPGAQQPFILGYNDVFPFLGPLTQTPQCVFNPDTDGNGFVDDLDTDASGNDGTDVDDHALAAGAMPAGHTTCFFESAFEQDGDGDWESHWGVLNIGDGLRGTY